MLVLNKRVRVRVVPHFSIAAFLCMTRRRNVSHAQENGKQVLKGIILKKDQSLYILLYNLVAREIKYLNDLDYR